MPSAQKEESRIRQTFNQISDIFYHPFSADALRSLPSTSSSIRTKAKRADRIPDTQNESEIQPLLRDYHSINDTAIQVRVPKKIATPVRVESKVWFANERTFVSYISISILTSTLALALWNASEDLIGRWFAGVYAVISIAILGYGYAVFQKRLTMISARDAGQFDLLWGPLAICAALFIAILANFILRYQTMMKHQADGK